MLLYIYMLYYMIYICYLYGVRVTSQLVVSSTGRVRRAALHTYIPIYEAMDSSTTHHS